MPNILGREINIKRAVGKSKVRSQMLLLRTDDSRLLHRESPVYSSCAVDDELSSGFLIDRDNQYQDEKTGDWFQIIDEKSTIPICLLNKKRMEHHSNNPNEKSEMEKLLAGIFHNSWTMALANLDRQSEKDKRNNWLYAGFGIAAIACALFLATSGIF